MSEHHHHWVLIDGYTNAYTCCDCGATRGEKKLLSEVRPVHSRRFLGTNNPFSKISVRA